MIHSPSPRFHNPNWSLKYQNQYNKCQENQPKSILLGDSIIAGLERYKNVWESYFSKTNTVNCGIGGDRVQNVHWRANKLPLSPSLKNIVLFCGTNNICIDSPREIAEGIINIAVSLKKRSSY